MTTTTPTTCEKCKQFGRDGLFKHDGKWLCAVCKYGQPMRPSWASSQNDMIARGNKLPDLDWHDQNDR